LSDAGIKQLKQILVGGRGFGGIISIFKTKAKLVRFLGVIATMDAHF
jgi:hypothetical protein